MDYQYIHTIQRCSLNYQFYFYSNLKRMAKKVQIFVAQKQSISPHLKLLIEIFINQLYLEVFKKSTEKSSFIKMLLETIT